VTHEYTILYDAIVLTGDEVCPRAKALAWAADTILAIGETAPVRAISRGDSRFIALPGRLITPAPARPDAVERSPREAVGMADTKGVEAILASFRRPDPTQPVRCLEIGEPADLAIWSADPAALAPREAERLRIEAIVRGGRFTRGDPIHGPYHLDPALAPQCLHPGPTEG
jgi:hypothetical protein